MSEGRFRVYRNPDDLYDIVFEVIRTETHEDVPSDQAKLVEEVNKVLVVLRSMFKDINQDKFDQYFGPLLSAAQVGLVGSSADQTVAMSEVSKVQQEIVENEGARIKNGYLKRVGLLSLIFIAAPLLIYFIINLFFNLPKSVLPLMLVWIGSACGVWLSLASSRTSMNFTNLNGIIEDRLDPAIRLVYAGLFSIVFATLFILKITTITIGNLSTYNIVDSELFALIVGVCLGFSEKTLASNLRSKIASIVQ